MKQVISTGPMQSTKSKRTKMKPRQIDKVVLMLILMIVIMDTFEIRGGVAARKSPRKYPTPANAPHFNIKYRQQTTTQGNVPTFGPETTSVLNGSIPQKPFRAFLCKKVAISEKYDASRFGICARETKFHESNESTGPDPFAHDEFRSVVESMSSEYNIPEDSAGIFGEKYMHSKSSIYVN